MTNSNDPSLSRRKWLGLAAGATLGLGLLAVTKAGAAETKPHTTQAAHTSHATVAGHDFGARTYNIRDFGAKGDGKTLDTAAVQAAIDACNKEQGRTVLVPARLFVIRTVAVQSH